MNTLHDGRITLHHGDCLDLMRDIPDQSVDAIICDPPYGTTACKWDSVIPFDAMWLHLKRIIKPRGAIVLFGSQPFTSALVMSNPKWFRCDWTWYKTKATGHLNAKRIPMRQHEDIIVFSGGCTTYNPQGLVIGEYKTSRPASDTIRTLYGKQRSFKKSTEGNYPKSILHFAGVSNSQRLHTSQKPIALLEYLIRTYTNPDETVLDFTFGSCTAGVAALNTDRRFIGIERDDTYYNLGLKRVQAAIDALPPMPL